MGLRGEDPLAFPPAGDAGAAAADDADVRVADATGIVGGGGDLAGAALVVAEVGAGGEGGEFGFDKDLVLAEGVERVGLLFEAEIAGAVEDGSGEGDLIVHGVAQSG